VSGRVRSKLTYANVTATLALFVALGGSSYAAIQITGRNVKDSSLTTKDVKNRSLLKADFKPGQLPAGAQGLQGLQGFQGPKGDQGTAGQNGADGAPGQDGADGAPGTALAYAYVNAGGFAYAAPYTKNVDRSTQHGPVGMRTTGIYCLHTPFAPYNAVATLYTTNAPGSIAVDVRGSVEGIHCDAGDPGYNVIVYTYDSTGAAANKEFLIAIN
jgi:hypothetical protein